MMESFENIEAKEEIAPVGPIPLSQHFQMPSAAADVKTRIYVLIVSDVNSLKPRWTLAVQFRDEFLRDKISAFSVGFRPINNNTVELVGSGGNKFDGARWSRGFSGGKHVIEFIYPVHLRAVGARVGLGTKRTVLGGSDVTTIVGGNGSLAIDLVLRKVIHNDHVVKRFPSKKILPDWFFMYIDFDAGTMQFGSDTEYYGTAFSGVMPTDEPLYPIVTGSLKGAIISIVYRGQGKDIEGPLRKKRALPPRDPVPAARAKKRRSNCPHHK